LFTAARLRKQGNVLCTSQSWDLRYKNTEASTSLSIGSTWVFSHYSRIVPTSQFSSFLVIAMAFQSTMSRLAAVAFVLLSLGFLVQASPIAAPAPGNEVANLEERGKNCYGSYCYGGLDLVTLLLQLQAAIELKLSLLGEFETVFELSQVTKPLGVQMDACTAETMRLSSSISKDSSWRPAVRSKGTTSVCLVS
jgi:hypothetical protein